MQYTNGLLGSYSAQAPTATATIEAILNIPPVHLEAKRLASYKFQIPQRNINTRHRKSSFVQRKNSAINNFEIGRMKERQCIAIEQ